MRAFVSSSGRLWLDGSNAPQAVLSASMSVETTLRAFLGGDGDGGGAGLAARWAHRYLVENLDGGGDPGSEAACGAAAALRAATCGEATGALLAAFDAPPAYQKLAVAAGRIRTQARPTADQPIASPSPDPTHTKTYTCQLACPQPQPTPLTHDNTTASPLCASHVRSCSVTPLITSTSVWPGGSLGRWRTLPTR